MLSDMMARADPMMRWSDRSDAPRAKRRFIEIKESATPFDDDRDLRSVAILYVTRAEAQLFANLARQVETARGRNDMISFIGSFDPNSDTGSMGKTLNTALLENAFPRVAPKPSAPEPEPARDPGAARFSGLDIE